MAETNTVIVKKLFSNWKYNFFFPFKFAAGPWQEPVNPFDEIYHFFSYFHPDISICI